MMTHGGTDARGVTETDSDTASYRQLVLARGGAGVVMAARLTSAVPAYKASPDVAYLEVGNTGALEENRGLPL